MTPKKYPQNLHTPKNIHFSENPKNIEIQIFEPPKSDPSLRMYETIRAPPPPPGVLQRLFTLRPTVCSPRDQAYDVKINQIISFS